MSYIAEQQRMLEITGTYDVLVAGGGIAGVSAALAAARNGAKVVLLEREYGVGGLATLGLIAIYLPLCDGRGHQVCAGICEELFRLSIRHGMEPGYSIPVPWLEHGSVAEKAKVRYKAQFNPVYFSLEMEKLLRAEGVTVLYGTQTAGVIVEDRRIKAVITENKSGRSAIVAKSYVDATGDADLFRLAGLRTSLFSPGNALASWYYYKRTNAVTGEHDVKLSMFGLADEVPEDLNSDSANKNEKEQSISDFRFSGVDGPQLSEAVQRAHALMLEDMEKHAGNDEWFAPVSTSSIPLVRMSCRIEGDTIITASDVHRRNERSIGMTGDWCKRGPVYEIPFESLYSSDCVNLLAAGRIISSDETAWNVTRVIPPCAVTGQAAGTAAALSDDMTALDIKKLQDTLKTYGVLLHEDEVI